MWKYVKLLAKWKDVRQKYAEENQGKQKPWYYSRRFFGAVIAFVGYALFTFLNITIDESMITSLADNFTALATAIGKAVSAFLVIYGHAKTIYGWIKRSKATNAE